MVFSYASTDETEEYIGNMKIGILTVLLDFTFSNAFTLCFYKQGYRGGQYYSHEDKDFDFNKLFNCRLVSSTMVWCYVNKRGLFRFLNRSYLWSERFGRPQSRFGKFLDTLHYPKLGH